MTFKKRPTLAEQAAAEQKPVPVKQTGIDYDDWKYEEGVDAKAPPAIRAQWVKQYKENQRAVAEGAAAPADNPLFKSV